MASKFLQITNHHIREEVTGKGTNLGVKVGLEIPLSCFVYGEAKIIIWVQETGNTIAMAQFRDFRQ